MTITNDGATILKLLEVEHPAAKVLCELADLQDKEVGDGTTSVVSERPRFHWRLLISLIIPNPVVVPSICLLYRCVAMLTGERNSPSVSEEAEQPYFCCL